MFARDAMMFLKVPYMNMHEAENKGPDRDQTAAGDLAFTALKPQIQMALY